MAAGVGSRFGGLKQLEPVGPSGEIILDYSIHDALTAGFERVVFVIRQDMEADFREVLGKRIEPLADTRYVFQELDRLPKGFSVPPDRKKPWGTGHAILCCRDDIDTPFAVINADDFYGRGSYLHLSQWMGRLRGDESPLEWSMVGFVLGNTLSEHGYVSRGVCRTTPEGFLQEVREHPRIEPHTGTIQTSFDEGATWTDLAGDSVVSMNMWGFTPNLFPELESAFITFMKEQGSSPKSECYIPSVVMGLLTEGKVRVRVLPTDDRWVGVTHRQDLPDVRRTIHKLVDDGVYPDNLLGT
jgi:dTDP-glucose pyrophosphorylase